jgi:hypothetical protein
MGGGRRLSREGRSAEGLAGNQSTNFLKQQRETNFLPFHKTTKHTGYIRKVLRGDEIAIIKTGGQTS